MIYLQLLIGFLKVGCLSFGGAYGAIAIINDVVISYGWLSQESLTYMIAVSESTPGPIMVNLATYIGSSQAGFIGAIIATIAVVLPAFIIIILLMQVFHSFMKNRYVKAVLDGLNPCIIGIISATGLFMLMQYCFPLFNIESMDNNAIIIVMILVGIKIAYSHFFKKKITPIALILISAILGVIIYSL